MLHWTCRCPIGFPAVFIKETIYLLIVKLLRWLYWLIFNIFICNVFCIVVLYVALDFILLHSMNLVKHVHIFCTYAIVNNVRIYIFEVMYREIHTIIDVTLSVLRFAVFHCCLPVGGDEAVTERGHLSCRQYLCSSSQAITLVLLCLHAAFLVPWNVAKFLIILHFGTCTFRDFLRICSHFSNLMKRFEGFLTL